MNKERIAKLIEILERVPDSQYTDDNWVKNNYHGTRSIKNALNRGFVGDVGGWACQCKSFYRAGLFINEYEYPEYNGNTGIEALQEFFGITSVQANALFFNLPTKSDVINYLKDMWLYSEMTGN